MASYGARLYNAAGERLPTLPLLSVQAGTVVNGVGECTVTFARQARPRAGWKDAFYVDVWRLDAPVMRVGTYWVQEWTERTERGGVAWTLRGRTPLVFLAGREIGVSATLRGNAAWVASRVLDMAFAGGLPYVAWSAVAGSAEGPSIMVDVRNGANALSTLQTVASTAYPQLRPQRLCYEILPTYTTGYRLAFCPAVWVGEYGADRRVGYGQRPVALRIDAAGRDYEATEDWSRLVNVVNVATITTLKSGTYFDAPAGNIWERTIGASSTTTGNAQAQAQALLADSEPRLRIPIDLGRDVWRLGLRLGDVVSVAYGGRWGTGRLNVLHVAADGERETVQARLDIEL